MNIGFPLFRRIAKAPDVVPSAPVASAQLVDNGNGEFSYVVPSGGGGSPGGSDGQIQYNSSGSFAGTSNLTWYDGGSGLSIYGDGDGAACIHCYMSDSNPIFQVYDVGGGRAVVGFGDLNLAGNKTRFGLDDDGLVVYFISPLGSCRFGDVQDEGNSSKFYVDDTNQKLTSNVDLEFTLDSKGPILVDRTTATKYRLFVNLGVLSIETV
jgi:hypothetical protein